MGGSIHLHSTNTAFFTLKSNSMATSVSLLSCYHPGLVILKDHMHMLVPKLHHMVVCPACHFLTCNDDMSDE